jgi:hypothetical protein
MSPQRSRRKSQARKDADLSRHSRKFNFRFKDTKLVITKNEHESEFHAYAKALAYAYYQGQYPTLRLEAKLEEARFQPDLSAEDYDGTMRLWVEVGKTSLDKVEKLFKKYRQAKFVFVKQAGDIPAFVAQLEKRFKKSVSLPEVEIMTYNEHFHEWYVSEEGDVFLPREEVEVTPWTLR